MILKCFRGANGNPIGAIDDDRPQASRPVSKPHLTPRKSSRFVKRQGSDGSNMSSSSWSSSKSNESIAKLPPCNRASDPKIEAMMMPLPNDPTHRPSKCLRLSYPKIYGALVSDMKASKGCRDWRNFAVFPDDDVDMKKSAIDVARDRALEYERKMRQFESSFDWSARSEASVEVDMIG